MAARTTKKASKKAAPATRKTPARRAANKPKAATSATSKTAAASKTPARRAADKPKAATAAPKPASMTGRLPPIVTLKHLAEWAGYNHDVPKKQAIAMLTGFVADIGRVLKIRPARPARRGRNPATGEAIQIKASKASKKVAFRVAKALKEAV